MKIKGIFQYYFPFKNMSKVKKNWFLSKIKNDFDNNIVPKPIIISIVFQVKLYT